MKYLLVSFFLLSVTTLLAQEERIIKGKIVNDSLENSVVHIINVTQKTGTITSTKGEFDILARENDTLLFSSLLYIPQKVKISSTIYKDGSLNVELIKNVNELEEVNISNIKLSGDLNRDLSTIKSLNKYDLGIPLSTKPLPTQAERRLMANTVSINPLGGAVNLDHLINVISGRHALNIQAKANEDKNTLVAVARDSFSEEIFVNLLNIPLEEISVFLFFCAENANLKQRLDTKNQLGLLEFFKRQAPSFRKYRGLE
ncbi:hypothetical protein [Gillisia limnaea]|uniref:Uncharacterized protein n=1 Tax=Gillisia limnaea (strain DSM 15749 / LMG 21470 / R-8282) TaxID=865937 RepID=H2BZ49_GILLR|nr:hypothetical protein [Gillisia limnaea]EHQ03394.1 hypothetical protein Gilli_2781 [Gillisia limnaea DSM 15749]